MRTNAGERSRAMADDAKKTLKELLADDPDLKKEWDDTTAAIRRKAVKDAAKDAPDSSRVAELEDALETAKNEAAKYKRDFDKLDKSHRELSDKLANAEAARQRDAVKAHIASEMDRLGVVPHSRPAIAKALLADNWSGDFADDGSLKALKYGDKSLADFAKEQGYIHDANVMASTMPGIGSRPSVATPNNIPSMNAQAAREKFEAAKRDGTIRTMPQNEVDNLIRAANATQ